MSSPLARRSTGDSTARRSSRRARCLSAIGAEAYLKAELFQRTGSFKPRGMLAKVASLSGRKRRGIVTWSAGTLPRVRPTRRLSTASRAASSCARCESAQGGSGEAYGAEVDLDSDGLPRRTSACSRMPRKRGGSSSTPSTIRCCKRATARSGWRWKRTCLASIRSSCRSGVGSPPASRPPSTAAWSASSRSRGDAHRGARGG